MSRNEKIKKNNQQKNQSKKVDKPVLKLTEDMENEIKDAFKYYTQQSGGFTIDRNQLRSILGNFAYATMNVKEIEEELKLEFANNPGKNSFVLEEVIELITKKWFHGGGRMAEAGEIFKLFDKKNKGVGLNEIKQVFGQYLDIGISDTDILEFIEEADLDQDGILSKEEFCTKLGYM